MNAQNLTAVGHNEPPTAFSGFTRALSAELIRTRRSASARIPLLGLLMCVVQGAAWWTVATPELATWNQLFAWQTLWATGIMAPIVALVIGLTAQRENRAREGGTQWRPIPPATIQLARATVLAGQLLILQLMVTVPIIVFGWLKGLSGAPVGTMALLAIVLWGSSALWAALALLISRVTSLWVAVAAGLIWQLAGVLQAESSLWPFLPWTWSVRPALPLLGIHGNGVQLEPHSPIWGFSIGQPVVLSLVFGAAVLLTTVFFVGRARKSTPRRASRPLIRLRGAESTGISGSVKPGLVRALSASLRRTPISWLVGLTLVVIAITTVGWPASYLPGLVSLFVLPFGCCLLAYLVWSYQEPAWRVLALRRSPDRLGLGLGAVCLSILTLIVLSAAAAMMVRGTPAFLFAAVAWSTGAALLAVNLWLVTRLGVGAAIGLALVMWVLGIVLGASEFATTPAWLGGFVVWPFVAATPERAAIAIPISLAVACVAGRIWLSGLRKAAAA